MKRFLLLSILISLNLCAIVDPQDGENIWRIIKRIGTTLDVIEPKVCDTQVTVNDGFATLCSKIEGLDSDIDSDFEVVCSKLEKIDSDLDMFVSDTSTNFDETNINIDNTRELLCSKIELLDSEFDLSDILSVIEILEDKLCAITDGSVIEVIANDPSFISVFGDKIVGHTNDQLSIQFRYRVNDLDVASTTTNTGTIIEADSMATVSTGVDASGMAKLQTVRRLSYKPGHEGYAFFTAAFVNGSAADSTQWIGLFDDDNGFAVGYNNTTFSALFRRDGVDTTIAQASFNRDTIDGMGSSCFDIDTAMLNVFRISFGWLGGAIIKFQVMNEAGCWITFHVIERPNNFNVPSLLNPTLPVTSQVTKTAGATDLRISSASWNAGIIGFQSLSGNRYFARSVLQDIPNTTAEVHLITFQNKTLYQGLSNIIEIRIVGFAGGSITQQDEATLIRLRKNATVTGLSFSDINTTNSVMEFSTAGTYTASTGIELVNQATLTFGNGPSIQLLPQADIILLLLPGESLTITAQSFSPPADDVIGTLWWEERH